MKKILGLDLGTSSIGWAVLSAIKDNDGNLKPQKIESTGSRIIPMDVNEIGDFNKGTKVSKTANRTAFRGVRRLRERYLLRRERLHRVLNILKFLPNHYAQQIGWDRNVQKTFGKFLNHQEPKLAWQQSNGQNQFLFMDSFHEMIEDFNKYQPHLIANNKKLPLDWTIYYLRKKALTEKITKEELAWLILNFNQKRGYYQLRGEDEIVDGKKEFVQCLKIIQITKGDIHKTNNKRHWYNISLENGWMYKATFFEEPKWLDKTKEFLITEDLDENGNIKIVKDKKKDITGKEKRKITLLPSFEEIDRKDKKDQDKIYKQIKARTEITINDSGKTVGVYIYDTLLQNPSQKIIGKLVRTIGRKFYRDELEKILNKQSEFHPELQDKNLFKECIDELYQTNEIHKKNIAHWSFTNLFIKDILFYQRPLKSKKSLISDCPFEKRYSKKGEFGVKCIAKSHPLFQEFRLWKFVANLKIYQREKEINGKLHLDYDVTSDFLRNEDDYVKLFELLNNKKEINQESLLKYFIEQLPEISIIKKSSDKKKAIDKKIPEYRWNYVEDKSYPCNETRASMLSRLNKAHIAADFLTQEIQEHLWHILYSVEDTTEIEQALKTFANKHQLNSEFVEIFLQCPPFKKEYGSFSAKAIKKLLPLMRMGKYWKEDDIDDKIKKRIATIINTAKYDEKIKNRVREKLITLTNITDFKALPEWLACYIVYDRFSEAKDIKKWKTPEELKKFITKFKQHSLRNPIVEQIILETLRTVYDIWIQEGHIDEIHVELGREMKNDKKERERLSKIVTENEKTNLRIKKMLMEFKNPAYEIQNVIPYSPSQQEILKIYEEYAIGNLKEIDEDFKFISEISKNAEPTESEISKYKCWLEQRYQSPYTGVVIPLSKLFTNAYQIEHIIPQSRFFDDSFSNKVICEAEVNDLKGNKLAYEFIQAHHGEKVYLSESKDTVEIFSVEKYKQFVQEHYSNSKKKKNLLLDEIPEKFIARQMNDTRYISKEIIRLLSNIVREEGEKESTSKHLIPITGDITDRLKKEWGSNDKWNQLVLPRFERLNELTGTSDFTAKNKQGHTIPKIPLELSKGFKIKRIDHRHHAMDAIVIACATRDHVQYLNNENAKSQKNHLQKGLAKKLRRCEDVPVYKKVKNKQGVWVTSSEKEILKDVPQEFYKPWDTFPQDVKNALDKIIVSFKQNLRVINKSANYFQKFDENGKKVFKKQEKGDGLVIRKSMHKETYFGKVNLRKTKEVSLDIALKNRSAIVKKALKKKIITLQTQGLDNEKIKQYFEKNKEVWNDINLSKISVYYFTDDTNDKKFFATRKPLVSIFLDQQRKFIRIDKVREIINNKITDTGIQQILLNHLALKDNNPELAFSPEGIEEMNRNIKQLNKGKNHQPIFKVRWYEKAYKFAVGKTGNKKNKFVEAADSTNLFFGVYQSDGGKRDYNTIPLNTVIDRQKKGLSPALEIDEKGNELLFVLSPNDLVYVPTTEELEQGINEKKLDRKRIYKMVSSDKKQCFFISSNVSSVIVNKKEFSASNKMEKSIDGFMIKEICIPIKVDRLGNIIAFNGKLR